LRIILTRTVGYDHIDLGAAKELGIKVAYAPNYSPNAVAELSVTLALSFLRNIPYLLEQEKEKNFIVDEQMFAKEIRECTVGILGCGNIGMTSAKLFKALGAKVIGYDKNKFTSNDVISYVDFETLLEESDIISIHLNYIKGQNDHLIDAKAITKMKSNCIVINTSRSEVLNYEAVIHALENNELKGLAADVIPQESQLFFQDLKGKEITNPIHQKLLGLFPKVIVTPHIGSSTMTALYNSIDMSLHNLQEIRSGKCSNLL